MLLANSTIIVSKNFLLEDPGAGVLTSLTIELWKSRRSLLNSASSPVLRIILSLSACKSSGTLLAFASESNEST